MNGRWILWAGGTALVVAVALVAVRPLTSRAAGLPPAGDLSRPIADPGGGALAGATADAGDSSNCVACHTSQDVLKSLAKEPEQAESLSEGEG